MAPRVPDPIAGGQLEIQIMILRLAVVGITALGILLPALSAGGQDALPDPRQEGLGPSARIEALLERVRLEQGRVESLRADFIQRKESAMLLEPAESRGRFAFSAPDKVRWEYSSPSPISVLIVNEEMITWYRDIQQAERVSIGRQSQRVLEYLGAGSSMDELLEYFLLTLTLPTAEEEPYTFELSPKFDKVAKRIQGMTVWIHPDHFLPSRLRYIEPDGDVTDLRFENIEVNSGAPEGFFELDIPSTVEIRVVELDPISGAR